MKILTIIGARPQFIKAAPISRYIRECKNSDKSGEEISEILVHTGQHYDDNMSEIFFDELSIPQPDYNLGVGSGLHGKQTALMLERIEEVLLTERPDIVLVYGDTNSTLAGALTASKLQIPVAHVESGVRSHNRHMPEEINRVITDRLSSILLCPTETAIKNLKKEGIVHYGMNDCNYNIVTGSEKDSSNRRRHIYTVKNVGDVMYDSALFNVKIAKKRSGILDELGLLIDVNKVKKYCLATIHRPENTDNKDNLMAIMNAVSEISKDCYLILPLHPRTKKFLKDYRINVSCHGLKIIPPVSYLDMLVLEKNARIILTDSGGVQKEAYFFKVPCLTLREETEWVETVDSGYNFIVGGSDTEKIIHGFRDSLNLQTSNLNPNLFGDGNASAKIINLLKGLQF